MTRKTIGFIVAIIGAILVALQEQFGLNLDPAQVAPPWSPRAFGA